MFSSATNLKTIRFEVNSNYIGKITYVTDWKKMEYSVGMKGTEHFLILKYRINLLDPNTNDEILGYLGEKHCKLAMTTIENDKPILINVLARSFNEFRNLYNRTFTHQPFTCERLPIRCR
jgi:hypothetical protein